MRISFATSGETAAVLSPHDFAGKSGKDVKRVLVHFLGATRYSQRLLTGGQQIPDDQIFTEDLREVQVLLLPFKRDRPRDYKLLLLATERNDAGKVEMFLDTPLDPGDFGGDPLYAAARQGNLQCVKLLLEANAFNFFNSNGHSTLWIACNRGHAEVVGLLLAASAGADIVDMDAHVTPLMTAASAGNAQVTSLLLAARAEVDGKADLGVPALNLAARFDHCHVVELLLQARASQDLCDDYGETPLTAAAWNGNNDVVKLLLTTGAQKDLADLDGDTPLIAAAKQARVQTVSLLLAARASVNRASVENYSPLWFAALNDDFIIAASLLDAKADLGAVKQHALDVGSNGVSKFCTDIAAMRLFFAV